MLARNLAVVGFVVIIIAHFCLQHDEFLLTTLSSSTTTTSFPLLSRLHPPTPFLSAGLGQEHRCTSSSVGRRRRCRVLVVVVVVCRRSSFRPSHTGRYRTSSSESELVRELGVERGVVARVSLATAALSSCPLCILCRCLCLGGGAATVVR